jgi:hypothetical protein
MSVLLEYHSIQPVPFEVAAQIENDQKQLLKNHCYWSEPLFVALEQTAPARLVGSNSLFNSGGYTTQSGRWVEVSQNEDYLMAWSDTDFIVNKLAAWSKEHGMDWSVYSAGDHIGNVIHGEPDKNLQGFLNGLLTASTLKPDMVPVIDQKFKSRCEPPQPVTPATSTGASSSRPNAKKPWWQLW